MELKEQILVALGLNKPLKLSWQAKSEDGTIFVSTADTLEVGVDISVLTEDGTTIAVPAGTYTTAEGVTFRVEEDGIVAEVLETETEEVVEEDLADVADWEGMEKRIQNLEDAVAKLKEDKVGGDTESEELADEEETEDVVTEVVETVEAAVEEIAAAIDDATPEEVTPELATKAAEVAVEVMQEKAEEVAEATELASAKKPIKTVAKAKSKKRKYSKLEKENETLKEKLRKTPADKPLNTNKFSSDKKWNPLSKADLRKMTKRERFLYDLNK